MNCPICEEPYECIEEVHRKNELEDAIECRDEAETKLKLAIEALEAISQSIPMDADIVTIGKCGVVRGHIARKALAAIRGGG